MALGGQLKLAFGPLALTTTPTTNVYNNSSALIYDVFQQIVVVNKTGLAATFSLWLGATGANVAGTELFSSQTVQPFSQFVFYWQPGLKVTSSQFIVGGAGTATALTIYGMSQQVVV